MLINLSYANSVNVPTCRLASSSFYELETLLYISIRTLWGLITSRFTSGLDLTVYISSGGELSASLGNWT